MRCSHPPFYIGSSLNGRGLVGFFHKRIKVHVQETFHKAVFTRSHSDLGAGSSVGSSSVVSHVIKVLTVLE
jgi:hypothetical protein